MSRCFFQTSGPDFTSWICSSAVQASNSRMADNPHEWVRITHWLRRCNAKREWSRQSRHLPRLFTIALLDQRDITHCDPLGNPDCLLKVWTECSATIYRKLLIKVNCLLHRRHLLDNPCWRGRGSIEGPGKIRIKCSRSHCCKVYVRSWGSPSSTKAATECVPDGVAWFRSSTWCLIATCRRWCPTNPIRTITAAFSLLPPDPRAHGHRSPPGMLAAISNEDKTISTGAYNGVDALLWHRLLMEYVSM